MTEHRFQLDMAGILTLLGDHLYADPRAALREVLQNAADSCQRRRVEGESGYHPRIEVRIDKEQRRLLIEDNGSGLTADEIHAYLATIGRGYTRQLRERIPDDETLVGQFGLGLLAAFIVADRVEMITKSAEGSAWRWSSGGGAVYQLEAAQRKTTGTTLVLHLKTMGAFLLNEGLLKDVIQRYADFLPVPIMVGGEQVNAMTAPWVVGGGYTDFLAERFDVYETMTLLPIRRPELSLYGVLYVPVGAMLSLNEFGDVAVYIRRMFVTEQERDLLPKWAKFVRGVIDCALLEPTASRESVRKNNDFYKVQRALEDDLLAHFEDLAENWPSRWQHIVMEHNDLIKGWALENHRFFEAVRDRVTFDTSRGRLTLPTYREQSGGPLYYFGSELDAVQQKMLYEAVDLPVIDASRFAEEDFLAAYARDAEEDVPLHQLEPGSEYIFTKIDDEDEAWLYVTSYYSEQGIDVKVASFAPQSIPAVLIFPPGSGTIDRTRSVLEEGQIAGAAADLLEEYLRMRDPHRTAAVGTLHINARSPLIENIRALPPEEPAFTAALEIIYQNARFLAGRLQYAGDARLSAEMISYSLQQMIDSAVDT